MPTFFTRFIIALSTFILCSTQIKLTAQISIPRSPLSVPNGIMFQALAKDNSANPAKNRVVYVQTSILQGSATTGTVVLKEQFQVTTDATGVFTIKRS